MFIVFVVFPVVVLSLNQTIISPNTATFNCTATAKPRAIIQWIRNGMILRDTTPRITMTNFTQGDCNITSPPSDCVIISILGIINIVPDDDGEYTCNASNSAGNDAEIVSLIVNGIITMYVYCPLMLNLFVSLFTPNLVVFA